MKPIIFSTPMVQAILAGNKTQTRRVIKPQPEFAQHYEYNVKLLYECENRTWCWKNHVSPDSWHEVDWLTQFAPYQPGDILWLRETWRHGDCASIHEICDPAFCNSIQHDYFYYIDEELQCRDNCKWRPSIHMPRAAARIFLRVKSVRCERLHAISTQDIVAEGWKMKPELSNDPRVHDDAARDWYHDLWDLINTKRDGGIYAWDRNPFVWVYEFERIERKEPEHGQAGT